MGCIDHKDREIVLFENGALGYLNFDEDSDLRAGSSYVSIINELSDLKIPPNFLPSRLDWPSMKRKYIHALIIIYGLILILIIVPFVLRRGTWNDMISVWTGVDFNGWPRYCLAFIACMFSLIPEIIVSGIFGKRENQAVLTLEGKHGITEIICIKGAFELKKQLSWSKKAGIFSMYIVVASKVAFMALIFIDFFNAIVLGILAPFVIFCFAAYSSYKYRKALSEDEIKIPEAELSEIFAYMKNRWGSTQLEHIIAAGESRRLEFKSSLWYDYDKADLNNVRHEPGYNPSDKAAKNERARSVMKAVTGFLNSNASGRLLIGVDDDGQILGLKSDFELLNTSPSKQRDQFEIRLDTLLMNNLESRANLRGLWDFIWLEQEEDGGLVCMLTIKNSPQAVFLKVDGKEIYYIRTPSKTEPIKSGIDLDKELEKFPR